MYDIIFILDKIFKPESTQLSFDNPFSCAILIVIKIFPKKMWLINKFHAFLPNIFFYFGLGSVLDPGKKIGSSRIHRIPNKNTLVSAVSETMRQIIGGAFIDLVVAVKISLVQSLNWIHCMVLFGPTQGE